MSPERTETSLKDVVGRLRGVLPFVGRRHKAAIVDACDGLIELAERLRDTELRLMKADLFIQAQQRRRTRADSHTVLTYPDAQVTLNGEEEARPSADGDQSRD